MTNSGPWTAEGAKTSTRFSGLDSALVLVMIVAGLILVFGVIIAFADNDPGSFTVAGLGLTTMIMCGLGRVLIHIAQTVDQIAADAKEVRGIGEWWLSHGAGTPGDQH